MESFNKNKGFYIGLIVILLGFCAGVAFAVVSYLGASESESRLQAAQREVKALLDGHEFAPGKVTPRTDKVSLTPESTEAAAKDLAELGARKTELLKAINGDPDSALKGRASVNSSELASMIRQSVDEWQRFAQDKEVRLLPNDKCDFGFRRYIRNPGTSPRKELTRVDQQREIINYLFRLLVESRPAGAPLLLLSVDREPVETFIIIPEGKPGAGTLGPDPEGARSTEADEFVPSRTFRRKDLVETLSFRVRFAGTTPTFRTFINKLRNSGRPFAITSVDVGLPNAEAAKILAAPAAAATPAGTPSTAVIPGLIPSNGPDAAPKDERITVVTEKPSDFTVQIDYLTAVEAPPASEGEAKK
ncbi:MAG: hypothetical protein ACK467_08915 [Opitutia bacterium]|jgi:hypothetical protein